MNIDDADWRQLVLPGDPQAMRTAVEAMLREYVDDNRHDQEFRELRKETKKAHAHLDRLLKLAPYLQPDEEMTVELKQRWASVNFYAPVWRTRRERLLNRLSVVWTKFGGKVSISEDGPFVAFICTATNSVFDDRPISGRGIKDFATRELVRRELLDSLRKAWQPEPTLSIDETKISVLGNLRQACQPEPKLSIDETKISVIDKSVNETGR